MTARRLLLCTDMDRTVIPNGHHPEHPAARKRFREVCRHPEVRLAYVTGRHLELVLAALNDYALPQPDFAITDVGSRIYQVENGQWRTLDAWEREIAPDWRGLDHDRLRDQLSGITELSLQEEAKQNRFKLSYYLPLSDDRHRVLERVATKLAELEVAAGLTWSVDDLQQVGLLDVLPQSAGKLQAILFLKKYLGFRDDELLFAGDSGNDLPVLGSGVPAVLVANAAEEVRAQALEQARRNGREDTLYLAENAGFPLGGNYAAGILQGIAHFFPEYSRMSTERSS